MNILLTIYWTITAYICIVMTFRAILNIWLIDYLRPYRIIRRGYWVYYAVQGGKISRWYRFNNFAAYSAYANHWLPAGTKILEINDFTN